MRLYCAVCWRETKNQKNSKLAWLYTFCIGYSCRRCWCVASGAPYSIVFTHLKSLLYVVDGHDRQWGGTDDRDDARHRSGPSLFSSYSNNAISFLVLEYFLYAVCFLCITRKNIRKYINRYILNPILCCNGREIQEKNNFFFWKIKENNQVKKKSTNRR